MDLADGSHDGENSMDSPRRRVVVVAPTYQERGTVEGFLRHVRRTLPDAEVLIVDDASPDGTAEIARRVGAELGGVTVLERSGKAGLGSAYRHGFAHVAPLGFDIVVTMDVDASHNPDVIPSMLAALEAGADAVIGSRYVPGGATLNWPAHRRWLSRWGNRYTAWLLGVHVRDCTSGFRAYRSDILTSLDVISTSAEGYAFLTELARRLARQGRRVVEVPIIFADREVGESKMSGRIIAESMWLVTSWGLSDRWERRRGSPTSQG
jgi:dolichol-phosphate mannosyltransferase